MPYVRCKIVPHCLFFVTFNVTVAFPLAPSPEMGELFSTKTVTAKILNKCETVL